MLLLFSAVKCIAIFIRFEVFCLPHNVTSEFCIRNRTRTSWMPTVVVASGLLLLLFHCAVIPLCYLVVFSYQAENFLINFNVSPAFLPPPPGHPPLLLCCWCVLWLWTVVGLGLGPVAASPAPEPGKWGQQTIRITGNASAMDRVPRNVEQLNELTSNWRRWNERLSSERIQAVLCGFLLR